MNCSNCGQEMDETVKFCSNCGKENDLLKKASEGSLSIRDLILIRDKIAKNIDLEKSIDELTVEDKTQRIIYDTFDKIISENMGAEDKEKLDSAEKEMRKINDIEDGLRKIITLGQEIEKNFFTQYAYLSIHFDKSEENKFYTAVDQLSEALIKGELSNEARVQLSKDILNLVDTYEKTIWSELSKHEDLIDFLLSSFEMKLSKFDFDYLESIQNNDSSLRDDLFEWLRLSKEVIPARKKGLKAVKADLEKERIIPKVVIENGGDITINMSPTEMNIVGQEMVDLINESDRLERAVADKRKAVSVRLFGEVEGYMEVEDKKETEVENNLAVETPKKKSTWLQWAIVAILSIIALANGIWTAIGVFILGTIIIYILFNKS